MTDQDKLALGEKRADELKLRCESHGLYSYYAVETIHKLLGDGVEMTQAGDECGWWPPNSSTPKHAALLIGIRPIVQESEERKLLRDFVAWWKSADYPPDFLDRAIKLLERP